MGALVAVLFTPLLVELSLGFACLLLYSMKQRNVVRERMVYNILGMTVYIYTAGVKLT